MLVPSTLFADARLRRVLHVLNGGGEETRIVGGAVRNALLGRAPGDIDLATTLTPEGVIARAAAAKIRAVPTGLAHGTVTLLSGGLSVEVTTLREDVETDGRHAVVRFGRDFARDAERRDFTMNALSAGLDGRLHDPVGGVADLQAGRVRFIGDPATRIREDYLRILRFFRFHAAYGQGPLDPAGLAAASALREGLDRLSRERVRTETMKLLAAPGAVAVVPAMAAAGILAPVLGREPDLARFARLAGAEADPLLRLAALAVRTPVDVDRLRDRLRLTNAERDRLLAAVRALGDPLFATAFAGDTAPDAASIVRLLFAQGRGATTDAVALAAADREGDAWDAAIEAAATAEIPDFPFSGADLTARGLRGPAVRTALALLREAYAAAGFPSDPAACRRLLAELVPPT